MFRISEPQPVAEARTEEEKFDEVYSRLASTVEEARTKLERVIVSPQFKEALYYILLGRIYNKAEIHYLTFIGL